MTENLIVIISVIIIMSSIIVFLLKHIGILLTIILLLILAPNKIELFLNYLDMDLKLPNFLKIKEEVNIGNKIYIKGLEERLQVDDKNKEDLQILIESIKSLQIEQKTINKLLEISLMQNKKIAEVSSENIKYLSNKLNKQLNLQAKQLIKNY